MLIANVHVHGRGRCHVLVRDGRIAGFPVQVPPGETVLEGCGRRLIPGLADPHLHLMAVLASEESINARALDAQALRLRVEARAAQGPVRVVGYCGAADDLLDRHALDDLCPRVPLRLQYQAGHLWVLNSAALDALPTGLTRHHPFERGPDGCLTGRVWRGDALLRAGTVDTAAAARLGRQMARWGLTTLTDASATTDDAQAAQLEPVFAQLPQRIQLMGGGSLAPPRSGRWSVGALKVLLDEADLPPLESLLERVGIARAEHRSLAIHCVGHAELALAVAALCTAGTRTGDRIEHGSMIGPEMLPVLADLGLTVVVQPGFVPVHGDRYLRDVPPAHHADLCRLRSLLAHGIRVALSSDAPYGPLNPWTNLRSAIARRTATGVLLNQQEAIEPDTALALHSSGPAGLALQAGQAADLCLLRAGRDWMDDEDPVDCTFIGGDAVYMRHPGTAVAAAPSGCHIAGPENHPTTPP